jgi:hypothetical protein
LSWWGYSQVEYGGDYGKSAFDRFQLNREVRPNRATAPIDHSRAKEHVNRAQQWE